MPELATPVAAPAPSGGFDAMIAQQFAPPVETPAVAPTPSPKPAETPAAPEVKATSEVKPDTKAKKTDFTDAEIDEGLQKFQDEKGWGVVKYLRKKYTTAEAAWNAEKSKLEARPQTPANDERIAQLEKLIEEGKQETNTWKQRTEEEAYTRGETYLKQFVQPYQSEVARGIAEVAGTANTPAMTVTEIKNNEETTRPATARDFQRLLKMEPEEWDAETDKFGRGKQRVVARMLRISDIREREQQAREEYSANYEKNKVAKELEIKRQREAYEKELAEAHSGFQKDPELGKYLTEAETDPEGTKLFKTALEKFDSFKTVQPTAADAAEVRASYAMKPRLMHEVKQLTSKIASLEAEIAKMRGTDPGQPVKTVTGSAAATPAKGVDGLIAGLKWGT